MSDVIRADVCVIGGGSGGLSVAAGAARLGARVVLVEKGRMGGDCLNTGCVPSKALLAAGRCAQRVRDSGAFGVHAQARVDWRGVHRHVREVIEAIAPHDSVERFEGMGVRVIRASARFVDARTVEVGKAHVRARFFVVATGSSPFVPPILGLDAVDCFTNETIFDNTSPIRHLIVIGGGAIGMEMAQAHRRLGAEVTLLEAGRLLPGNDPEAASVVAGALCGEGVALHEKVRDLRVARAAGGVRAVWRDDAGEREATGSHLLVATGRRANVAGLGLEAAGICFSEQGIEVDARLRTSNRRVFAIGDVAGPYRFTHMAAYQAGIVIRNMLFRLPAKARDPAVPWVIYTDPELAHAGMSEADAMAAGVRHRVLRAAFAENDRAIASRCAAGVVKVVVRPDGRVLGADIAGPHAGELIQPWVLAIRQRLKIGALATMIAPYPTLGEINKQVAASFYEQRLFSPGVRRLVRLLLRV